MNDLTVLGRHGAVDDLCGVIVDVDITTGQQSEGDCPVRYSATSRTIMISNGYEAMLRARGRRRNPDKKFIETYSRHRWKVEGMHGEAKTQHGLRRAVRRGLVNVAIQAYLTAAVINLKRLAAFLCVFFVRLYRKNRRPGKWGFMKSIFGHASSEWQNDFTISRIAA